MDEWYDHAENYDAPSKWEGRIFDSCLTGIIGWRLVSLPKYIYFCFCITACSGALAITRKNLFITGVLDVKYDDLYAECRHYPEASLNI